MMKCHFTMARGCDMSSRRNENRLIDFARINRATVAGKSDAFAHSDSLVELQRSGEYEAISHTVISSSSSREIADVP